MRKSMKMNTIKSTLFGAAGMALLASGAFAAGGEVHIEDVAFAQEGIFGTYDQMQLQRGLQVYTEICSACHGLQYVPIRTLSDEGGPMLPEDQVRQYATDFPVNDEDSNRHLYNPETGEFRPLAATDNFPAHNLAGAPDLSLMAKKRAGFHGPYGTGISQLVNGMGGAEYIHAILMGYEEPPACAPEDFEGYYNKAFANGGIPDECKDEEGHSTVEGSWIAMSQPIYDDLCGWHGGNAGPDQHGRVGVSDVDGRAKAECAQGSWVHRRADAGWSGGDAVPDEQAALGRRQRQERPLILCD
jgi:ubiquinol-cytochrome c reductase cytochrome c1 subunit